MRLPNPTTPPDATADAALIAACEKFDRLQQQWWNLHNEGADQVEDDPERAIALTSLKVREDEIAPTIWTTPTHTLPCIQAKARSWLAFSPEIFDDVTSWDKRFRASIWRQKHSGKSVPAGLMAPRRWRRRSSAWIRRGTSSRRKLPIINRPRRLRVSGPAPDGEASGWA
jgi:hypothetical protein